MVEALRRTLWPRSGTKRESRKFHELWGQRPLRELNWESVKLYFQLKERQPSNAEYVLDEATWGDLNLDEIYSLANRTTTPLGAQCLYDLFRRPLLDPELLDRRDCMITALQNNKDLRERVQIALRPLEESSVKYLPYALWTPLPERPRHFWGLVVLAALSLVGIPLAMSGLMNPLWLLPILLADILVHVFVRHPAEVYSQSFRFLGVMIDSAAMLSRMDDTEMAEVGRVLRENLNQTRAITKRLSVMHFKDPLGIFEYLKIFLFLDLLSFYYALNRARLTVGALRVLFETIGYLDALISIASFRVGYSGHCRPEFMSDGCTFAIDGVIHPLICAPVPNSFVFLAKAAIITGSNMAGKTTFLRTVGINAVLAQTIMTTFATRYRAPLLKVMSCIGSTDDIVLGKSYYMAEVEAILTLLEASRSVNVHLFILDEIYRGTNSIERKAASLSVLEYLNNEKDFVLVATHDLSVSGLLAGRYKEYHFRESVTTAGLGFDYRLHPGAAATRNAIALLEFAGYPKSLIANALAFIEQAENRVFPEHSKQQKAGRLD